MRTNYDNGATFERAVRADLQADGYWVMRAAGSKTKVDLLAVKPGQVLIIQCKRNGVVGPAERKEIIRVAEMINTPPQAAAYIALPIIAWKRPGTAKPQYWRLFAPGPKDKTEWVADEVTA